MTTTKRIPVQTVQASLTRVADALKRPDVATKGVDLEQLRTELDGAKGAGHATVASEFVAQAGTAFAGRTQRRGGSSDWQTDLTPARSLSGAEAQQARALVEHAATRVAELGGSSGAVDWNTAFGIADNPRAALGAPSNKNDAIVLGLVQVAFQEALGQDFGSTKATETVPLQWRKDGPLQPARQAADDSNPRVFLNNRITATAYEHAKGEQGPEAISWAFREKLLDVLQARGNTPLAEGREPVEMQQALRDAERSLFAKLPGMRERLTQNPHLDDGEVRALLGTDDLERFSAEAKKRVEQRVGAWDDFIWYR